MEIMADWLDLLKYILPSLVVFLTAYYVLRSMIRSQDARLKTEIVLGNQRIITPIRLQAYERMVLFLERISLESLIMRLNKPGMTVQQLHQLMLQTIRQEYDHNLSQQVYISPSAWEVIKNARGNILKIINTNFEKFKPDTPAIEFSRQLMEQLVEVEKQPTQTAIEYLKAEIRKLF
ncbi:MAG: hypothetical protein GXO83_10140 [Chlorobi bacterium]|nr:hypothetical protein [Chlorobiota bacterium]